MRVCSVHGCPNIYAGTTTRCPQHEAEANQKHWAKTRPYNSKGHRDRFRPGVLLKDPQCVLCRQATSVVADHFPLGRDELIAAGMDPDDPKHGRGLCDPCNRKQTAARQPGGWNNRA